MFSWECGVLRVSAVCFNPKPYSRRHVSATFLSVRLGWREVIFVKGVFQEGEERRVVLVDVLAAGCFGPDDGALVFVHLLVNGNFESSGLTWDFVYMVRKLAGADFLDFSNSCKVIGFVFFSPVNKLDTVGCAKIDLVF